MALTTHSRFFFNYNVTDTSNTLDFGEGGPELEGLVAIGEYSFTEFAAQLSVTLNEFGALDYTVIANRDTRTITISASGDFELLVDTGSRVGTSVYPLAGFTTVDRTGTATYDSDVNSGSEYTTQFIIQDFIPSEIFRRSASAVVNTSASGRVEIVKFGEELFLRMNFMFITDRLQGKGGLIRNRPSGLSDFLAFMNFAITKAPIEFMPDEDAVSTFETILLDKTSFSRDGVGFRLREQFGKGLPDFFDSGPMTFRNIEF